MCDIYGARCECGAVIVDWHLEDFDTPREDVQLYCSKCNNSRGYHYPQAVYWIDRLRKPVSLVALTKTAKFNWEGNHPNEDYVLLSVLFMDRDPFTEERK